MEESLKKQKEFADKINDIKRIADNLKPYIDFGNHIYKHKRIADSLKQCIDLENAYKNNIFDLAAHKYIIDLQDIVKKWGAIISISLVDAQKQANEFLEDKKQAENNYYHNLVVGDIENKLKSREQRNIELEQRNIELEQKVKGLEQEVANRSEEMVNKIISYLPKEANGECRIKKQLTLKPNITPSQVTSLFVGLRDIFEADINQWISLFSDTEIEMKNPIKATQPADIAILFFMLFDTELINTSKYPSILERMKVFSIAGKIVTSKQINKVKANSKWPTVGKSHDIIIQTIKSLRPNLQKK